MTNRCFPGGGQTLATVFSFFLSIRSPWSQYHE
jgi:hypothetical protein